jgi:quercetin dioxygenase-like cupin family protein
MPHPVGFCPVPHTLRDKVWLVVGAALGAGAYAALAAYFSAPRASTASAGAAPRVLPAAVRVADVPGELAVDEHVGHAGNGDAGISIASVSVGRAHTGATQTPRFDEYILVRSGEVHVAVRGGGKLVGKAGDTLHLPRGYTYTVEFPGPAEFTPICLPAFAPSLSGRA